MAEKTERKRVLILTDSRGAWLSREVKNYARDMHIEKFDFRVIYRKGAGLALLWEIAEFSLLTRKIDIIANTRRYL